MLADSQRWDSSWLRLIESGISHQLCAGRRAAVVIGLRWIVPPVPQHRREVNATRLTERHDVSRGKNTLRRLERELKLEARLARMAETDWNTSHRSA